MKLTALALAGLAAAGLYIAHRDGNLLPAIHVLRGGGAVHRMKFVGGITLEDQGKVMISHCNFHNPSGAAVKFQYSMEEAR